MDDEKRIVIVSDSTGRTAERLMKAVLAQYAHEEVDFSVVNIYQQIRDRKGLDTILGETDDDCLVIYSIISTKLSKYFHERLSERDMLHLNVLEPMLSTMRKFLGVHPDYKPGILHVIDDRYYRKVDAIGYTVEHDDGLGAAIENADVVLLGPSRTCKTPISIYLACNHGMNVANIPLIRGVTDERELSRRLVSLKRKCVFGLLMQPDVLAHVREERSQFLTGTVVPGTQLKEYCDLRDIRSELSFCRELCERRHWRTIDVTRRAIEEISQEILENLDYPDGTDSDN
jgi:regulator of PEP synthase PpsR (kinase-PPPase family)